MTQIRIFEQNPNPLKALKDFFTDVTDIDNKLIRTLVMLFRSPRTVVQARLAKEETYVKPLRYAVVTTTCSAIVAFAYDYFFIPEEEIQDWQMPVRLLEISDRYADFFQNFFPFIILITIVPFAILLMKLFFFQKTWREISIILLYAFGQFWVLMLLVVWIETTTGEVIVQLTLFTGVFVLFRKLFTHVWFSFAKWLTMTLVMIIWFHVVCIHFVTFAYSHFITKPNTLAVIRPHASGPTIESWPKQERNWNEFVRNDPENTRLLVNELDTGYHVTCFTLQRDTLWNLHLKTNNGVRYYRIKLPSQKLGWLIVEDYGSAGGPAAIVLDETGERIYTQNYEKGVVLNCGAISGYTLLLAGGKDTGAIVPFIHAFDFSYTDKKFVVTRERSYSLPHPRQRFMDIFPVQTGFEKLDVLVSKYEVSATGIVLTEAAEISQLSLMRLTLDTALHTQWETLLFQKTTHYSPRIQEFYTKLDTITHRITSTYPLPNDSLITSQLFHLDLDGKLIWRKDISEIDYTRTFDFAMDATGVYYCGATGNGFTRHPTVHNYRLALVGYISADGKSQRHLRYGKFENGEWGTFNKIIPGDSALTVFGFHRSEGLFGEKFIYHKLVFHKNDLKQKDP